MLGRVGGCAVLVASLFAGAPAQADNPFRWTGFYGGLNAGYGWNNNSVGWAGDNPTGLDAGNHVLNNAFGNEAADFAYNAYSHSSGAQGAFVGGQLGYNLQIAKDWVAGIEVDIQTGFDGDNSTSGLRFGGVAIYTATSDQDLKYFGTVRGRLGFLASPQLLLFGTGGLAYGRDSIKCKHCDGLHRSLRLGRIWRDYYQHYVFCQCGLPCRFGIKDLGWVDCRRWRRVGGFEGYDVEVRVSLR